VLVALGLLSAEELPEPWLCSAAMRAFSDPVRMGAGSVSVLVAGAEASAAGAAGAAVTLSASTAALIHGAPAASAAAGSGMALDAFDRRLPCRLRSSRCSNGSSNGSRGHGSSLRSWLPSGISHLTCSSCCRAGCCPTAVQCCRLSQACGALLTGGSSGISRAVAAAAAASPTRCELPPGILFYCQACQSAAVFWLGHSWPGDPGATSGPLSPAPAASAHSHSWCHSNSSCGCCCIPLWCVQHSCLPPPPPGLRGSSWRQPGESVVTPADPAFWQPSEQLVCQHCSAAAPLPAWQGPAGLCVRRQSALTALQQDGEHHRQQPLHLPAKQQLLQQQQPA